MLARGYDETGLQDSNLPGPVAGVTTALSAGHETSLAASLQLRLAPTYRASRPSTSASLSARAFARKMIELVRRTANPPAIKVTVNASTIPIVFTPLCYEAFRSHLRRWRGPKAETIIQPSAPTAGKGEGGMGIGAISARSNSPNCQATIRNGHQRQLEMPMPRSQLSASWAASEPPNRIALRRAASSARTLFISRPNSMIRL